jgi:hypothetical protein
MFDIQFKLSDFVLEFSRFRTDGDKIRMGANLLMIHCLFQQEKVNNILNQ